jgi:hypothetical protein
MVSCSRYRAMRAVDSPSKEVAKVVELAVLLVFDVDDSPAVLAATNRLAIDDDVALGADDGEGDHVLRKQGDVSKVRRKRQRFQRTRMASLRVLSSASFSSLSKG